MREHYDTIVVGAGLAAIGFLRATRSEQSILVVDYQSGPGGFFRPALDAPDLGPIKKVVAGFTMPSRVEATFRATAVGLLPAFGGGNHAVLVRTAEGTQRVEAGHVIIASGALELTREHDRIPGSRPAGVFTPILVHQLIDAGYLPGHRAVVNGASAYALATAARMAEAGIEVTLLPPAGETVQPPAGVRVESGAQLIEVLGFPRVERLRFARDGEHVDLAADTLVYATGVMPNTLWLKGSGVEIADDGRITVDDEFATNLPGVFAVGTVVQPDPDHSQSIEMGERLARSLES